MTIQVSLPAELEELIQDQVTSGLYGSASDLVKQALCDFFALSAGELNAAQIAWLQQELGPRLCAVQDGTATLIPANKAFNAIDQQFS